MNPQIGKRKWLFLMAGGAACLITPLLLLWLTAPADPVHNGVRLSTRLYRAYGKGFPRNYQTIVDERKECELALKKLGSKASPLLKAWIENKPSRLREKLCEYLRKRRIDWPYITADRQDIVERLFFDCPAAAVPVADAFQWQILHGEARDASRAATLFMSVINSVDDAARKEISERSREFAIKLIDRFEADGQDCYALVLVGPILSNLPEAPNAQLRERVSALGRKSRYLEAAAEKIRSGNKER